MDENVMDMLTAQLIAEELWALTVEGIEQGELTSPTTIEGAFIAGVMSAMAALSVVRKIGDFTEKKAAMN